MSGNDLARKRAKRTPVAGGATWVENWFRPTVVAAMLTCIVVAFVELISRLVLGWRGLHYIVFAFLVAWVSVQSERLLKQYGPGYSRFSYRAVEAVVLLLLFRLIRYVPLGWNALWDDIGLWTADPVAFLDSGFILGGIGVIVIWLAARTLAQHLYALEIQPGELPPERTSPHYDLWMSSPARRIDRGTIVKEIVNINLRGGVVLLVLTGLSRFKILTLYKYGPPPLSGLVINVLLYFALGLVLISQAHFSVLRVKWRFGRIEVSSRVGTRWAWQAVVFLSIVLGVTLILPTGYSVGLPQAIVFLASRIVGLVVYFVSLLFYFLIVVLDFIFDALGVQEEFVPPSMPELPQGPSAASPADSNLAWNLPWFDALRSVLFWVILLVILGYSLYHFLRERRGLIPGIERGLWDRLLAWLRGLWHQSRRASTQIRQAIVRRVRRSLVPQIGLEQRSRVRLSRLSPRQRVRYFYLSVLQRATRAGYGRQPQQTPHEYRSILVEQVPEVTEDVTALTQAFVEARYSRKALDDQRAGFVETIWKRMRAAFAQTRSQRSEPTPGGTFNGSTG